MNDKNQLMAASLCLIGGTLAMTFGQGHFPNGWLLLVGITLWKRFFRISKLRWAFPLFVMAHLLVSELAYYGMVPLPTPARLGMFTAISIVFGLIFLADRWVNRRIEGLVATLVLPCGWVAFDLLSARLSPGGTWASIAYAFADNITLLQVVSLFGWTGITFLIVWVASMLNWLWGRCEYEGVINRKGLTVLVSVVAAVCTFGVIRLHTTTDSEMVRVACIVAPNTFNNDSVNELWAYTRGVEATEESNDRAQQRIQKSMDEHFSMVEDAMAFDPDIVVWPEANAVMTIKEEPAWVNRAREIARKHQVSVGMGYVAFRPGSNEGTLNKFVLVQPSGETAIDFMKATRVPGSGNAKGDGVLPVVDSDFGRLSSAICFDMDFPHAIAQAGAAKIDLFFAPSNDWRAVRDIHAQMAKYRAIEQGFALVRPTKDGTTLITDSSGGTVASLVADDNRTAMLVAEVPAKHRWTLYSLIGDTFGFACTAFFGVSLVFVGLLTGPRRNDQSERE